MSFEMPVTNTLCKEIRAVMREGDYLSAYDLSDKALADGAAGLELEYLCVLCLAKCGATERAIVRYEVKALADAADAAEDHGLALDVASLWGRLLKDRALHDGTSRRYIDAARAYESVFARFGQAYPAVNAATLWLLAGDSAKSELMARDALVTLEREREGSGTANYWALVTEAEARLLLDPSADIGELLREAAVAARGDWASIATTRRQLGLILQFHGFPESKLDALTVPTVIHYAGHLVGPRFPLASEPAVAAAISAELERIGVGAGYGSLAAGADILFAEALLARGAKLNVVLPFDDAEFRQVSVIPFGEHWGRRFDRCLAMASEVHRATSDRFLGDDALFSYGSRLAIGFALLKASAITSEAQQFVVWDGDQRLLPSGAGTSADLARWLAMARPAVWIDSRSGATQRISRNVPFPDDSAGPGQRSLHAMIFGDIKGFSKLRESQLPIFTKEILGRIADSLSPFAEEIVFRNTWGDGIFLVVRSSVSAAKVALAMQDAIRSVSMSAIGLPATIGLRLGVHFGPIFALREPITGQTNYFGDHVSRAARIEPITPEGEVYVTEPFAADLVATGAADFSLDYVGKVPAHKAYGDLRMYSLKRERRPHLS